MNCVTKGAFLLNYLEIRQELYKQIDFFCHFPPFMMPCFSIISMTRTIFVEGTFRTNNLGIRQADSEKKNVKVTPF